MNIIRTDRTHPDLIALCYELDLALDDASGGFENRKKYVPFNQSNTMDMVVILYDEDIAIGCGAYRLHGNGASEIKRMFVKDTYRGKGYGRVILQELIHANKENGINRLILETGSILISAISLYKKMGFEVIPNYPPYDKISESVCMELIIT